MNYLQFLAFLVFSFSVLVAGVWIYRRISTDESIRINRFIFIGESLFLGSTLLYGGLMIASLLGMYNRWVLWTLVLLNFLFLLNPDVRREFTGYFLKKVRWNIPLVLLIALLAVFFFRNCFFLGDVDSHSTYLYTQKLWLEKGSSLVGDAAHDIRIFIPQFDTVFYGLGLSLFPHETLFPQLINLFWRLIVLLLVFGYVSSRRNRYYALAAVCLVAFNDHFLYSGENICCTVNAALMIGLFASAYRFWEGRLSGKPLQVFLAILFLSQLMSNKYQMAYPLLFLGVLGLGIQKEPFVLLKKIAAEKKWIVLAVAAYSITGLWFVKNWIVTGLPTFPLLAGNFSTLGWEKEQQAVFMKVLGGLDLYRTLKFLSYSFIWPGITAAKITWSILAFWPLFLLFSNRNPSGENKERIDEINYWLIVSVFLIIGICLALHQDPRYYRFPLPAFTMCSVLGIDFILQDCFGIRNKSFKTTVILLLALSGIKILLSTGGPMLRPSLRDNLNVLFNKTHTGDIIGRYFANSLAAIKKFEENPDQTKNAMWDMNWDFVKGMSAFLLPTRPQYNLWVTSVVKWSSYPDPKAIVRDLQHYGVDRLMRMRDGKFEFLSLEQFAQEASCFDRYPKETYFNYGFPAELSRVEYK